MTIKQSETSLSTTPYNNLLAATGDFDKEIKAYRQTPSFDQYLGRISRDVKTPFAADASADTVMRVINIAGSLYSETMPTLTPIWNAPVLISNAAQPGVQPRVVFVSGTTWHVYFLANDGEIFVATSTNDGVSWSGATFTSVTFTPTDITSLSYAGGALPLVYVIKRLSSGAFNIIAVDASAQYDTGIYWSDTIYGFDAIDFKAKPDDTSGTHTNTDARHCLLLSAALPAIYTFKTVNGTPAKAAQPTGGTISFIVRPPNAGRTIQISRFYPAQTFDQWRDFITTRTSAKIMATNSYLDQSNSHDTLWAVACGFDGDFNSVDNSVSYAIVAYYSSRDGKHWSQERIIPLTSGLGINNGDFPSATLVRSGQYLFLLSATAAVQSKGCFEFNNTHSSLQADLTSRVLEYSSTAADARQTTITLDNLDGGLWSTFLGDPGVITLVTKFGLLGDSLVQMALEEVDSIEPSRERPREQVQIVARDYMGRITDRIENADAIQWDNQIAALDTFSDINGVKDSGLAHSDVVKGDFTTSLAPNILAIRNKYKEAIRFDTNKAALADGDCDSIFDIPKPTDHGGTSSADSPSYAGVVFRAQDKDNLWACWYNYWTGKIELVERKSGVDTILQSYTPTVAFTNRANASSTVGIRVEFKHGKIVVYESTVVLTDLGARYTPSFTYIVLPSTTGFLEGYTGNIGCGFSDQDQGDDTAPDPTIIIPDASSWGTENSYEPTAFWAATIQGRVYAGTGAKFSPVWRDISPTTPQRLAIGDTGSGEVGAIAMITHPYHFLRLILLGQKGILICPDASLPSPVWTQPAISPQGGYQWAYITGVTVGGMIGAITGSINWDGYFCWLEMQPTDNTRHYYFVYTHDDFATIHRTDMGIRGHDPNGLPGITLGQYASNWNNINVWVNFGFNDVFKSVNGGQSFALDASVVQMPPTSSPGFYVYEDGGACNMPYTLAGGIANKAYKGLLTTAGAYGPGFVTNFTRSENNHSISAFPGSFGSLARPYGTLTVDGGKVWYVGTNAVYRSLDGGETWTATPTSPTGPSVRSFGGWPTNFEFAVVAQRSGTPGASTGKIEVTYDGGTTWHNLDTGYPTADAGFVEVFADLTQIYPPGGVHST